MVPRFSIIIPVYNVAPYLRDSIDSVLAQGLSDWEIICVNDGSTDDPGTLLAEYDAKEKKRIRVIHQENSGVSAARNAAIDIAKGDYLLSLDADDALVPWALECLAQRINETNHPDILMYRHQGVKSHDEPLPVKNTEASPRRSDLRTQIG